MPAIRNTDVFNPCLALTFGALGLSLANLSVSGCGCAPPAAAARALVSTVTVTSNTPNTLDVVLFAVLPAVGLCVGALCGALCVAGRRGGRSPAAAAAAPASWAGKAAKVVMAGGKPAGTELLTAGERSDAGAAAASPARSASLFSTSNA